MNVTNADAYSFVEHGPAEDSVYETMTLDARWDGCVHVSGMRDAERKGYLHICNLDAFIFKLVEFRNRAATHYNVHNAEWPETTMTLVAAPRGNNLVIHRG